MDVAVEVVDAGSAVPSVDKDDKSDADADAIFFLFPGQGVEYEILSAAMLVI